MDKRYVTWTLSILAILGVVIIVGIVARLSKHSGSHLDVEGDAPTAMTRDTTTQTTSHPTTASPVTPPQDGEPLTASQAAAAANAATHGHEADAAAVDEGH